MSLLKIGLSGRKKCKAGLISKKMSFIGRVLVVNSIYASKWYDGMIYSIGAAASTNLYFVPSKGIH